MVPDSVITIELYRILDKKEEIESYEFSMYSWTQKLILQFQP